MIRRLAARVAVSVPRFIWRPTSVACPLPSIFTGGEATSSRNFEMTIKKDLTDREFVQSIWWATALAPWER